MNKTLNVIFALGIALALGLGLYAAFLQPEAVLPELVTERAATGSLTAVSAAIGGGFGNSGCTLSSAGALSCNGAAIIGGAASVTGTLTANGALTANGTTTIGDNGDTVAINSSDWDISTSGAMTGIGAITADGLATLSAGATLSGADVTLTGAANGGNAADRNEFIGLTRQKYLGLATGANGTTHTVAYIDATPTGEWAVVGATVTPTITADTTYYKDATNSLKIAMTDVTDNHGADGTISEDDLSTNEYIGFWMYSDVTTLSTYFDLTLDDTDGTDQVYAVPAVAANTWTWIEIDISGCDANCDSVNGVQFLATTTGGTALTAANIYLDAMYKWDADAEEAVGLALQTDGVQGCVKLTDGTPLVEYTGFFVTYRTGSDSLVYITDESADVHACLFAY